MVRWLPQAVACALVVAGALTATACAASDASAELALTQGNCQEAQLAQVSVLSVEVYGRHDGDLCVLRQRCIFNVDAMSVADIGEAMADANQPLIDVEQDGAMVLAVIGHTSSCFSYDDQAMCGFADLADAGDGILDVQLECQACPAEEIPFCP
jgi:hypothetical protein